MSIAYNGYERFIEQWLESVKSLKTAPDEIVVAVPSDYKGGHDCTLVYADKAPNMGYMRNLAVANTSSDWVCFLSIDDVVLPHAIDHYKEVIARDDPDVIMISWYTEGLGRGREARSSVTPYENYLNRKYKRKAGFLMAQSPFKRKLWQERPYEEHDLPNAPFFADLVEQGAKFTKATVPTNVYLRRADSHARTTLKEPDFKRQAIREKAKLYRRLDAYYVKIGLEH